MGAMDKKKITGIVVFAIALTAYIWYPNMAESFEQRRIEAMFREERYEEVYDKLANKTYDTSSWQNLAFMRSQFYLGKTGMFNRKIAELIRDNEKDNLQLLVDEFEDKIVMDYLMQMDQMGIVIKGENARKALSYRYYAHYTFSHGSLDNIIRAMEYRGEKEEIDIMEIAYHYAMGDIDFLVEIYENVPDHLKESYYSYVARYTLGSGLMTFEGQADFDMEEHFHKLSKVDFPEQLKREIGHYAAAQQATLWEDYMVHSFIKHPFFQENLYYHYSKTLLKLESVYTREEGLVELNGNHEYKSIEGIEKVLDLVNNGYHMQQIGEISKEGFLIYSKGQGVYGVDLFSEDLSSQLEFNKYRISSIGDISDNRSYYFASVVGTRNFDVLNSSFEVIDTKTDLSKQFLRWLNDKELFYSVDNRIYNAETGQTIQSTELNIEPQSLPALETYSRLYRVDDKTYTVMADQQPEGDVYVRYWGVALRFYQIRDIETDSIIYEMELPVEFLGSCEKYIYGLESLDTLRVLMAIDKETQEKIYFPFYLLSNQEAPEVRYIERDLF